MDKGNLKGSFLAQNAVGALPRRRAYPSATKIGLTFLRVNSSSSFRHC